MDKNKEERLDNLSNITGLTETTVHPDFLTTVINEERYQNLTNELRRCKKMSQNAKQLTYRY